MLNGHILMNIYYKLLSHFDPQNWWPAESLYEIIVGAILTQNTSWKNVEKVIDSLKSRDLLDERKILNLQKEGKLKNLIKPAGFYNIKSERLKNITEYILNNYGSTENMAGSDKELYALRKELLSIKGIGKETADTILLYCLNRPIFVIDSYTKRIFSRYGIINNNLEYDEIRRIFESNVPKDLNTYKEYHALIVQLGKAHCKKRNPDCGGCPLFIECKKIFN